MGRRARRSLLWPSDARYFYRYRTSVINNGVQSMHYSADAGRLRRLRWARATPAAHRARQSGRSRDMPRRLQARRCARGGRAAPTQHGRISLRA